MDAPLDRMASRTAPDENPFRGPSALDGRPQLGCHFGSRHRGVPVDPVVVRVAQLLAVGDEPEDEREHASRITRRSP